MFVNDMYILNNIVCGWRMMNGLMMCWIVLSGLDLGPTSAKIMSPVIQYLNIF